MLYLDYLAYNNALRHVSMVEKLVLGGGGLVLSMAIPRPIPLLALIVLMHVVMLVARISPGYIVRLWSAPVLFLAVSLVTVVIGADTAPFPVLYGTQVGSYYLGVTQSGLEMAKLLCLRSLAAVSCLFMIATTTPVAHLVAYGARISGLRIVMEIMLLTYRFIFVFLETAGQIYTAQQSRLGYAGLRRSLYSIAMLSANLGRKSFLASRDLYTALLARNYTDRLVFRYPPQEVKVLRLLFILMALVSIALTALVV